VERPVHDPVRSGMVNAGGPFDLRATATAADSTYAGIVRLVSEAEASQAPFVRLADRYAVWFLLVSLAAAGAAWAAAGAERAVAVLAVATPSPLILAAPGMQLAVRAESADTGAHNSGKAAQPTLTPRPAAIIRLPMRADSCSTLAPPSSPVPTPVWPEDCWWPAA
jgi:cation transport ATPase